ncbi:hypothetical protein [Candidatus Nitrosocosmicus arcticus]|uniref:Uncharacterized protein n=1 Tax=Candidatus Nitrosocosmicus arcticus TaxID=2035267 RepID=A0A557SX69_9ARCH|nr:hypothetical protein [Candidatus Nitrosocosmicus arcticus]TVP41181.1 exported protein of unknown function [Candidatus Nitrosocosmicus arcticus]
MQKLILLSSLIISAFLGTTFAWTQSASVQATSNHSGTVQCITAPCDFPPSQTTSNHSGTVQCITAPCDFPPSQTTSNHSGTVQCITAPCDYHSSQPLSSSPKLDGNDDTITAPESGIETPGENLESRDNNEPCLSPCPPGTEMCIQMCKPTGQQDIVNEETNFSPQAAEDSSDTLTAGESTTNDEDTPESESSADESVMSSN